MNSSTNIEEVCMRWSQLRLELLALKAMPLDNNINDDNLLLLLSYGSLSNASNHYQTNEQIYWIFHCTIDNQNNRTEKENCNEEEKKQTRSWKNKLTQYLRSTKSCCDFNPKLLICYVNRNQKASPFGRFSSRLFEILYLLPWDKNCRDINKRRSDLLTLLNIFVRSHNSVYHIYNQW